MSRWTRKVKSNWLPALLLAVPICYVLIQLFLILDRSYVIEVAMPNSLDDTLMCDGIIGVNEVEIAQTAQGTLYYLAQNGERVAAGDAVAQVYASEDAAAIGQKIRKIDEEIQILQESQNSASNLMDLEELEKQKMTAVYHLLEAGQTGDFSGLNSEYRTLQLSMNRTVVQLDETADFSARIAELNAQKEALSSSSQAQNITAGAGGYFVSAMDSQKKQYSIEQLQAMTPAQLQEAAQSAQQANSTGIVGKLWLDYHWYFYTTVSLSDAEKFREGDVLKISFPDCASEQVPVTVLSITPDEAAGVAKLELESEYINEDVVTLEQARAEISFETYKGLSVSKQALHVLDGQTGIYVKSGNMVYWRPVKVLFEGESQVILSDVYEDGVNEVKYYDNVIRTGKDIHDGKLLS